MLENLTEASTASILASTGDYTSDSVKGSEGKLVEGGTANWAKWMVHEEIIRRSRILVVDDEPTILKVVRRHLQDIGYQTVLTTSDSSGAMSLISEVEPDVVLLDIVMPHTNGLEILHSMSADATLQKVPVIIMTASSEPETKVLSLLGGATDFLRKPLDLTELFARVRNALIVKKHQDQLEEHAAILERQAEELERQVDRRTDELLKSRTAAIECLARAAEYRDDDTGKHIIRVGRYVALIADELGFEKSRIDVLRQAAQLHDVGKIGISDLVLLKPGKLDADEFAVVKNHCEYGEEILRPDREERLGDLEGGAFDVDSNPIMSLAAVIAATHHERWDGTGYPKGLRGEDIPVEGRMTAIADVYDALSSKRPYKEAFPHEKCMAILEEGRGGHFDPAILDAFQRRENQVLEVRLKYADGG